MLLNARSRGSVVSFLLVIGCLGPSARADGFPSAWRTACARAGLTETPAVTRTPIARDLVEYSAELRVGPGEFDRIGIHRVVRELAPWRPQAAPRGALLVHGSASTFRTVFAPGLVRPDVFSADSGLAPFLAEAGLDVWGIDLRWTKVPLEQTTFEFMRSWNFASHVEDVRVVAKIARLVRALTGSGAGRLFFSGHSLGADIVYAYANDETQRPALDRDVRGLVPLDINYKLVSAETQSLRDEAAVRHAVFKQQFDSGVSHFALGAQLLPFIGLGLTAPDEPSVLVPGFSNLQAATAIFSLTHLFYAPLPAYTPAYHFLAGTFDPLTGVPTGLRFADPVATLELALSFPPYQALIEGVEVDALISGAVDVPYDDHLGEITVPVFYVGAAGGFGESGRETLTLLGSADRSSLIVRLFPPGFEAVDFGHVDLLLGNNARELVWQPILDWMEAH